MKFKYKITRSVYVTILVAAVAVVSILCFTFNLVRLIKIILAGGIDVNVYDYASVTLCLILPIICIAFIIALLVNSYYSVDEKHLTIRLGFLKDVYPVKDVANLIRNVKTDVLTISFKDESTLRVIIDKSSFDDFSAALMKSNKNVVYGETDESTKK